MGWFRRVTLGGSVMALWVLGTTACNSEEDSHDAAGAERVAAPGSSDDPANAGSGGTGGTTSSGGGTATGGNNSGLGGQATSDTLSARYPGDVNIGSHPSVLFHDDFETGWGRWDGPDADTDYLHLENNGVMAHGGSAYLRSTVTTAHLEDTQYISSSTRVTFDERVDEIWWRFYARFPNLAPNPHHWIRMAAGTPDWSSSGLANTVPAGDEGFWFDFDANNDDQFSFYTYWYNMRSGRCDDGSATPGCAGDQGNTYYYGNTFRPPEQAAYPRDEWICIEIHAKANSVGSSDGELSFWVNDMQVGDYRPEFPEGTWLRDSFHTDGCEFSACVPPTPFEGFDLRSNEDVKFKSIFLDAYYERGTSANKRAALEERGLTVSDEQTVLYDDVVVAQERIGCVQ